MKYLIKRSSDAVTIPGTSAARLSRFRIVSAILATLIGTSVLASAQMLSDLPRTGLINTAGAAFNAATGKGYAVDDNRGCVHVSNDHDGTTRSVKVGANPVSIAVDSATGRAYVVNAGDGTVSILDGKADTVVATVPVGDHPYSIASDSIAGKIYITRTYSDQLMVIDAATNQVSSIKAGSPDLIAIHQNTHKVYLLSYEMGDLAILDGVTRNLTRMSVGMHAWGMALNQLTGTLYITKPGDGQLAVIEAGAIAPTFIRSGGIPCAVAVNDRTNTVYVADIAGNVVTAINGERKTVVATFQVGNRPEALTVDPDHNRVYVANTVGASISIIDGITNKVLGTQQVSSAPYALAINPVEGKVHVATLGLDSFFILPARQ